MVDAGKSRRRRPTDDRTPAASRRAIQTGTDGACHVLRTGSPVTHALLLVLVSGLVVIVWVALVGSDTPPADGRSTAGSATTTAPGKYSHNQVLVIGQYLDQLEELSKRYSAPIITGKTASRERDKLYAGFRSGEIKLLIVSKVANFAIDLPDANVAIQVSGTFGSRQEEAQRLGRVLRPKGPGNPAHFYTIVTRDTVDQDFGMHRQLFLTEQGYRYEILDADEMVSGTDIDAVAAKLIG